MREFIKIFQIPACRRYLASCGQRRCSRGGGTGGSSPALASRNKDFDSSGHLTLRAVDVVFQVFHNTALQSHMVKQRLNRGHERINLAKCVQALGHCGGVHQVAGTDLGEGGNVSKDCS